MPREMCGIIDDLNIGSCIAAVNIVVNRDWHLSTGMAGFWPSYLYIGLSKDDIPCREMNHTNFYSAMSSESTKVCLFSCRYMTPAMRGLKCRQRVWNFLLTLRKLLTQPTTLSIGKSHLDWVLLGKLPVMFCKCNMSIRRQLKSSSRSDTRLCGLQRILCVYC